MAEEGMFLGVGLGWQSEYHHYTVPAENNFPMGNFWNILEYFGIFWNILEYFGIF